MFYNLLLFLHIAMGTIGLISGSINMVTIKGGKRHKKVGRIFVFSMLTTGLSALAMAQLKPNPFLFIVGVFTIYLVGTADRYIKAPNETPLLLDWVYSLGMLVFGTIFLIWGVISVLRENTMGYVMFVFGSVGIFSVYRDLKNYRGEYNHPKYRLLTHIGRMVGGYTAAFTAVLVVNAHYIPFAIPEFVYWLAPTLLFTPLSIYWIKKRKR